MLIIYCSVVSGDDIFFHSLYSNQHRVQIYLHQEINLSAHSVLSLHRRSKILIDGEERFQLSIKCMSKCFAPLKEKCFSTPDSKW